MGAVVRTINYLRVSTERQGRSGLGLEAQRAAIHTFSQSRLCEPLAEYVEVESGKHNDRPELAKALHHAKVTGAILVIAKLDRLSRNAAFLLTLRDSDTKFIAADLPDANTMTVGIMAVMAQHEREATSQRTKEALQAVKARGTFTKSDGTLYKTGQRLGNPNGAQCLRRAQRGNSSAIAAVRHKADTNADDIEPIIADIRNAGEVSLRQIARALNERAIRTARGGRWYATSVKNLLARMS